MATTTKYLRGSEQTLLDTAMNSLTNNSLAISAAITVSDTGYILADITFVFTFGTNPTVNTGFSIWFLRETDGTNYEDGDGTFGGSANTTPARLPDVVIPVRAVTTAQRVVKQVVLPPGPFKCLVKNDGTGQTLAASGNTLKIKAFTYQGV
jgi:hypothetical protein